MSYELFHEVPLAAISPTVAAAVAVGAAGAAYNLRKVTPTWHRTIHTGEVGVWLVRGEPVQLEGVTDEQITAEEAKVLSDKRHYKIEGPGFNMILLYRKLQPVKTGDQAAQLEFEIMSANEPREKHDVRANVTYHVSPEGDNPVRSITRVKHLIEEKKDVDARDTEFSKAEQENVLRERIIAICTGGLGRVLSGWRSEELFQLTYIGKTEEEIASYAAIRAAVEAETISQSRQQAGEYGVMIDRVDMVPVVHSNAEVLRGVGYPAAAAAILSGPEDLGHARTTNGKSNGHHIGHGNGNGATRREIIIPHRGVRANGVPQK